MFFIKMGQQITKDCYNANDYDKSRVISRYIDYRNFNANGEIIFRIMEFYGGRYYIIVMWDVEICFDDHDILNNFYDKELMVNLIVEKGKSKKEKSTLIADINTSLNLIKNCKWDVSVKEISNKFLNIMLIILNDD